MVSVKSEVDYFAKINIGYNHDQFSKQLTDQLRAKYPWRHFVVWSVDGGVAVSRSTVKSNIICWYNKYGRDVFISSTNNIHAEKLQSCIDDNDNVGTWHSGNLDSMNKYVYDGIAACFGQRFNGLAVYTGENFNAAACLFSSTPMSTANKAHPYSSILWLKKLLMIYYQRLIME